MTSLYAETSGRGNVPPFRSANAHIVPISPSDSARKFTCIICIFLYNLLIKRCIFFIFPDTRFQLNEAGIMAQVFRVHITVLPLDDPLIPAMTMDILDSTINELEDGSFVPTTDEITILIVNGRAQWKVCHQNGRWQAINVDLAYRCSEE